MRYVSQTPPFRSTITQGLADTVRDATGRSGVRSGADTTDLPEVGDLVGGLYRLVRPLGEGAFGKVYWAERIDVPEHQAALKVMPRELYSGRNVERELVMLAAAGHPNIVQLKDHGATSRYVWFTMPVYEGETLAARLQRGTLSLREAYDIFLPIARGAEALHSAGLRHQDLKPENLFLAQFAGRLHPVILDLGVAAERTASFVAGTVLFASPEQIASLTSEDAESKPALDEKMDTYCLAATLLLSLVGSGQFPGANAGTYEELGQAHGERAKAPLRKDALEELRGEPRRLLAEAFRGWFSIDATTRTSMGEMAEQLEVLLEQEREEAREEARRGARQKANLRKAKALVGALVLAGLGVFGVAFSKRETLRLANELNAARADKAASFDKLETCAVSHRVVEDGLQRCKAEQMWAQEEFRGTIEEMAQSGTAAQNQCGNRVLAYGTKLKACDEGATAAAQQCMVDKERINAEADVREHRLELERDDCRADAEGYEAEMASLQARVEQCKARGVTGAKTLDHESAYGTPATAGSAGSPVPVHAADVASSAPREPPPPTLPAPPPPLPAPPASAQPTPEPASATPASVP